MTRLIRDICPDSSQEADGGTRTPDPFITSEVLYQLSYVGVRRYLQDLLFREARSSCSAGYETLVDYCCSQRN